MTTPTPGTRPALAPALFVLPLLISFAVVVDGAATTAGGPLARAQAAPVSRRIVAIGDIHGAFGAFVDILREAELVDDDLAWIGGDAILVQTGDFTDRGPEVRRAMDLLMRLQQEAPAAGGEAIVLLANHEIMNLISALRDVAPEEFEQYVDDDSRQRQDDAFEAWKRVRAERARVAGEPVPTFDDRLRAAWEEQYPLGYSERMSAFGPEGTYGRWLRTLPAAVRIGDTLFMHAGPNPMLADRSPEEISALIREEIGRYDEIRALMVQRDLITANAKLEEVLAIARAELARILSLYDVATGAAPSPAEAALGRALEPVANMEGWELLNPEGYMWFRGFALWSEDQDEAVAEVLTKQGVSRIVVAHTVQQDASIGTRFGGGVFLIDTGMLAEHYGGRPSALEILDDRFTAIYVGERVELSPGRRERVALSPERGGGPLSSPLESPRIRRSVRAGR